MEIKILQVFYGKDGLPYKDKDRQVHFPIAGTGFLGASNTTKIKFYYDELDNLDETSWVAVSKLPNGKVGSRVLESYLDEELNEHYALLELDNYYTQYKGDVFISLQGYQGGVDFDYDEENSQYEIHGTPTIAATGSIKFTINYANQFVGSGETDNINFQRILAALGTKLGIRAYSERVEELPSEGSPNIFYVVNDDPNNPTLQNIYIWNENTKHYIWVGDNSLNLGNYYTKDQGESFEEEINGIVAQQNATIQSINQLRPSGVATSATILAYTEDKGIWIGSDTGDWYYWNGSAYASGGTYQATALGNGSVSYNNLADDVLTILQNITKTFNSENGKVDQESIVLQDGYVDAYTGVVSNWSGGIYKRTDYLLIPLGTTKIEFNGNYAKCCYDKDKNPILSTLATTGSTEITIIPENAVYLIVSYENFTNTPTISYTVNKAWRVNNEEILKLKENVDAQNQSFGNTINKITPTLIDGYADYRNGNITTWSDNSKYQRTDYIALPKNIKKIESNLISHAYAGYCFYDEDKVFISGGTTSNIITIPDNALYIIFSDYDESAVHANKYILIYNGTFSSICCYGDSVTAGWGSNDNGGADYNGGTYPAHLKTLLIDNGYFFDIVNNGHGGERSGEICARLGGKVCGYLSEDITIPADNPMVSLGEAIVTNYQVSGSKIYATSKNYDETPVQLLFTETNRHTRPMFIGSKKVNFYQAAGQDGTIQYVQLVASEGKEIKLPKYSVLSIGQDVPKFNNINIVFMGINDGGNMSLEMWLERNKSFIDANPNTLICGSFSGMWAWWQGMTGTSEQKYDKYIEKALETFGSHFVDLYPVFTTQECIDIANAAGYLLDRTPEQIAADNTAFANHHTCPSLTAGGTENEVHFNAIGYYVFAKVIYDRLVALNMVTK